MTLNVGIAQTSNSLDIDRNFQSIMSLLPRFESAGVDVVLFPECSLSGFSAKMKECTSELLKPYLEEVQSWVKRTSIEVVLPSAVVQNGSVYNSGWWFNKKGAKQFYKLGLTESEKKFFSLPTEPNSKVFEVKGFQFALLICFEVEHEPWIYFKPNEVDAVLWPGYWGWNSDSKWEAEKEPGKVNPTFSNVNSWRVPVLQSNFAFNDLDGHKGAGPEGLSFIIDANNRLQARGPHRQIGGVLVKLEKRDGETLIKNCVSLFD
jgi:predicted amidohydrolase